MSLAKERKLERLMSGLPDTISPSTYNLVIGACLLYGFWMNALIVRFFGHLFYRMDYRVFLVGYFICVFAGVLLSRSQSVIKSFIGYNLIVLPIGALLSRALPGYASGLIFQAVILTGMITLIMMALAVKFPHWFASLGKVLGIALTTLVAVSLLSLLFGFNLNRDFIAYVSAAIFTLYIGYDWHKAQMYPKTLDNAVDCALDLYLDIINLLLDLLRIIAKVKSDD